MTILEFGRHKLRIAHGLTFVTASLSGVGGVPNDQGPHLY